MKIWFVILFLLMSRNCDAAAAAAPAADRKPINIFGIDITGKH